MASGKEEQIYQMFDRIAPTYDAVNRVLSFGQDRVWRQKLCDAVPKDGALSVLDVATGTADLLLALCQKRPNINEAMGVDLSSNMLSIGQKKIQQSNLNTKIKLLNADGAALPFLDQSFDIVCIAFGIRNIAKEAEALCEMRRVLKPRGILLILEFSLPESLFIRLPYLVYFRFILPFIGGIISKEPAAYRYLNHSVEQFPKPEQFRDRVFDAGFAEVSYTALSLGIATLYCARKA
ncbi:MAG TPA: bifunctional demethylmenaquinone methyltransferase/2-methoxy-6-polyprenyl-1,4-benzoquinol methylase UbiE [Myxococcota bacterium]|nr:bifunctional demethylmenaquinone methyltransferase/2-methoxy-6-polyprenyl-1,4-benzoquinol methylase UbiE [Myxococcota bacterium]